MTPTETASNLAPLRRAVKELEAAEDRAHASSKCSICKAATTQAVEQAREHIIQAARRIV